MPKSSQKAEPDLAINQRAMRIVIGHGVNANRNSLDQCNTRAMGIWIGDEKLINKY